MATKIGLVFKRASANAKTVSKILDGAEIDHVSLSVRAINGRAGNPGADLLLVEAGSPAAVKFLQTQKNSIPVILLAGPKDEDQAVDWLEQGVIQEYLLAAPKQLARLPHLVKAVLARSQAGGFKAPARSAGGGLAQWEILQNAVYQIAKAADEAETLDALLPRIHDIVGTVMPARNFYIALYNPTRQTIHFAYFVDEVDVLTSREIGVGNGLTAYVLRTGKSLLIDSPEQRKALVEEGVEGVGPPSAIWLGVPLFVDRIPIGVMAVQHYEDDSVYGQPEQKMLEYVSSQVAMVIRRKQAEMAAAAKVHTLESLAEIDREILAAEDARSILNLVCERIASLLRVPKSAILTREISTGDVILATYGFSHHADLSRDFELAFKRGTLGRHISMAVHNLKTNNFPHSVSFDKEDIRSMVVEGFSSSEDLEGALMVFDQAPRIWNGDEVQLVRLLAGQAALALAKIRLFSEARRRANQFEGLYQMAGELMTRRDLPSLLKLIVQKTSELHDIRSAFIYLYDEKTEQLELSIVSGVDLQPGARVRLGEGMAGRVAQSRRYLMVDDYSKWAYRLPSLDGKPFHAILEVPMLYQGHLVGVLGIAETNDSKRRFTDEDVRLISLFAEQASSILYNSRLFSQIEDRNRELDRLSRASAALLESMTGDIQTVCTSIANLLASEFNNSNCSIWLLRENSTLLEQGGVAGPFLSEIKPVTLSLEGSGVIAKAIRTGQIVNLQDVHASRDYLESWENTRSELTVPLRTGERILGAIDLQSDQPGAYSLDDQRLIELIASRAALMLDRVRLYQQTERRLGQLTVLSNIDSAIASSLDLQVTLNLLVAQLSTHLQADAVSALLLNPHLQRLEYAAGRGFRGHAVRRVSLLLGEDQAGVAALERRVVSVQDISKPEQVLIHPERIAGENFVSMYAIPLVAKGQVRGVIEIFFRRLVESDPEWTHFLEILARQAAVAVEDARLFNEMQRSYTELTVAYDAAIEGWSRIIQLRQKEPDELLNRLVDLTLGLARRVGISESVLPHIYRGVLLHDIGKLSIPESILNKSGPLTPDEWAVVHKHPAAASDLLKGIPYLRASIPIPYCHQENWDGRGYPRGLKGEEIPIEARVFAVVNAWLKMQYDRPYAQAQDAQSATARLRELAGREFDPRVVEAFCAMLEEQRANQDKDINPVTQA